MLICLYEHAMLVLLAALLLSGTHTSRLRGTKEASTIRKEASSIQKHPKSSAAWHNLVMRPRLLRQQLPVVTAAD
jgi:hypothetical protein